MWYHDTIALRDTARFQAEGVSRHGQCPDRAHFSDYDTTDFVVNNFIHALISFFIFNSSVLGKLLICGTTAWDVINRKNKATEETERYNYLGRV
jgi:hypothetical protein